MEDFLENILSSMPAMWATLVQTLQPALLPVLVLCLVLVMTGLPLIVLLALSRSQKKNLYKLSVRQITPVLVFFNWIFFAGVGVFFFGKFFSFEIDAFLLFLHNFDLQNFIFVQGFCLLIACLFLLSAFIWTIFAGCWKTLRQHQMLAWIFALIGFFCALLVPMLCLLIFSFAGNTELPESIASLQDILALAENVGAFLCDPSHVVLQISLAGLILPSLALAGSFGLVWVLVRRNHDDFGRDYYTLAAHSYARYGAVTGWATLAFFLALRWIHAGGFFLTFDQIPLEIFCVFCLSLAALLCTVIGISQTPMRHKLSMILALIFLYGSFVCAFVLMNSALWRGVCQPPA